ncbi:hypothetical protein N7462_007712 [Penicillium macrosclerotiorum]|uniref:uncharacterized protein n=1 Tax=Penicillium macrosclerotiorum TaxID=303699 RepID=UPI0025496E11|nr:uncharacterized protein N7462_007712 [Penicillium macrosclerotiorum]KAJ5679468.1 hypothetical protein N7462_007712 [Penicillium macrosclerotiorum]
MASSVGSLHTDSDGAGPGTRTPTRNLQVSAAAAAPSELSPPGSQPQHLPEISKAGDFKPVSEADPSQLSGKGGEPPIAAWKSKRSQDEFQRAMEHVIDKDFNLDEFGDPFDERDLEQKLL